ncbi:hypothetical protein AaE_010219 [Aphanomyces astaci]|uniref:Transposase Tc1-like domain-containing protein n=1 Tax=Aphanomyces astaci TaxID=112090 RepID=A0A6A4ZVF9_APHAT|nr:hypothetical protein AaE_010219 [Aphanomyces astaci]
MPQSVATKPNLTPQQRTDVCHHLLTLVARASLRLFSQSRLWKRATYNPGSNTLCQDVASRKKGRAGRKLKYSDLSERIAKIPKTDRTTIQAIAHVINVPKSTLQDYFKRGFLVRHSSSVKPQLTEANKAARLKWAFERLGPDLMVHDMMDYVHVDEKWFYMTRVKKTLYLLPGEEPPHRSTKSKRFITKVMFLSAVARPRWNYNTNEWFDGRIGTWHFTQSVPAQRSSRNRPSGTMVTVPCTVTRDTYRDMLIDNVIPAIKAKWPSFSNKTTLVRMCLCPTRGWLLPAPRMAGQSKSWVLPHNPDLARAYPMQDNR